MASKLRHGWDFHGNLVDPTKKKQEEAKKITGIWHLPELLKREIAVPMGIMTTEQYDEMNQNIYGRAGSIIDAPPVPGAVETIHALVRAGHEVDIITASGEEAFENAIQWCRLPEHNLAIPGVRLLGVGPDGDKLQVVQNLDTYLDDEFRHLDALKDHIDYLFLIDRGYNQHEEVGHTAERVMNFTHYLKRIREISQEDRLARRQYRELLRKKR